MSIPVYLIVCLLMWFGWLALGITYQTLIFPLLALVLTLFSLKFLYRPRENCIGVVYMFGRYYCMVDPNEWIILIPLVQRVRCETNLGFRSTTVDLQDVITKDRIPVNLTMKVFYTFDVRKISPMLRINVLGIGENQIRDFIQTNAQAIVRNQIIINIPYQDLCSEHGRIDLAYELISVLSHSMQGLGVEFDQNFGVKIINLQPNEQFQEALCSLSAAAVQGKAALERMRPFLEKMYALYPRIAWEPLLMELASAMTQNGKTPSLLISTNQVPPEKDDQGSENSLTKGGRDQKGPHHPGRNSGYHPHHRPPDGNHPQPGP